MTFRELMMYLEENLGNHHVPLNARATSLRNLFDGTALHHALMQSVARAVYDRNACQNVDSVVLRTPTLEALSPIRLETLRAHSTDIDLYHLLNDLCEATASAFGDPDTTGRASIVKPATAEIIPFSSRRRALNRFRA